MSKVDLQTPRQEHVIDSVSIPQNQQRPESVLTSTEKVTSKELEAISMFSGSSSTDNILEIGAAALVTGAVVFGAKKIGLGRTLLQKICPKIEESGFTYRKILGKKFNLKLSTTEYKPVEIPNNSLISQRVKNPHPTNLRKELERCKYHTYAAHNLVGANRNLSRTVGSLPSSWAKRFKSAKIQQEVDEVLSKYASEFHAVKEGNLPSIKPVQEELSQILGTEVRIQPLGGGKIGCAHKISALGEDCVYKVYYNKPLMGFINHGEHGNYAELLGAIHAQKSDPKHFAKFYMGKFGINNDGYILTKFIPKTENAVIPKEKNSGNFSKWLRRMLCGDSSPDNIRNGITLDYGLVGFTSYSNLSPKAQKVARELFPLLDGKSPEKLAKAAQKYTGTQELEEVKNYINYIVENNYKFSPEDFASKKSQLAALGLDYKPDLRCLFQHNLWVEPYLKDYGLTKEQAHKLENIYLSMQKS